MTAVDRAFIQGAAVALGILARAHGEPSAAADMAREMGLTLADFKQARCPSHDVSSFRAELRHLEQRRPA